MRTMQSVTKSVSIVTDVVSLLTTKYPLVRSLYTSQSVRQSVLL